MNYKNIPQYRIYTFNFEIKNIKIMNELINRTKILKLKLLDI